MRRIVTYLLQRRTAMFCFALLLFTQWGQADSLNFFKNYFVTGDYVVAGVGLRAKGVGGFATGTITMSGVPAGADIVAAFLYWETEESASAPAAMNGFFDGNAINAKVLGNPMNAPCWSLDGIKGGSGRVYRADVLRYLAVDQTNNVRVANGAHTVKLPDTGSQKIGNIYLTNGASLVVIYRILTLGTPLRAVVIYDGTYTETSHTAAMTQTVGGFYQASGGTAKMTPIVSNGEANFDETSLKVNGTQLSTTPFIGALGARWDNPTYNITLAQNAASYQTQATGLDSDDCLIWAAIVTSTLVTDSDGDGLLDVWETKGLHLNEQTGTFGGCSDFPAEPCVNLPAMGASSARKDIFVEMDWLHGNDGVDHLHIPKFNALNAIATTFSFHGIQVHFDVGNNYQQMGSPYIVPAAYAQGGEVVEESSLLCPNAGTKVCVFPNLQYAVLGWKIGFQAIKDGFPALSIPAHFAHNRKDIFHYALFAHAIGIGTTPPSGVPVSVSGVADRPGGDLMLTLGLWPSDNPPGCDPTTTCTDETGSVQVQAGTLMHELGHNLGLSHAGLFRVPNCMPNYPSVMNYLYQARGLIDSAGNVHVDYSAGLLPGLNENSLSSTALGSATYRVSFYGPLTPLDASLNLQSKLHCDGSPLTGDLAIRVDNPIGPIDWHNDGFKSSGPFAEDVDFNGFLGDPVHDSVDPTKAASDPTKRWLVDSNDWGNLNLQQVGARMNVAGLSADVGQQDLGQQDLGQQDLGQQDLGQQDLGQQDLGQQDLGQQDLGQTDMGEIDYNTVIATIDATSSGTPLSATSTLTDITLNWGAPSIGQIRHYNIYRSDPVNTTAALFAHVDGAPPATAYVDAMNGTTTLYNTTYTYFISSVDINGTASAPSGTVNGTVKHLFIAANNATRVYGDPNPTFTFVTTGLDPGLSGTTVCSTTAVPTSNVGNYPITCSGRTPAAGVTYTAGTLTITPAPLSLTAATNTKTYDASTSAAIAPLATGLKNSDTVTSLTETYDNRNAGSGKTLTVSPGYTINDGNGGGNYVVTTATNSTGVINRAPLTIAAATNTKLYDATTAAATPPVATGLKGSDTVTGLAETYDNKNVGAGKTLTVSSGYTVNDGNSGGNYTVATAINSTGVINKAPLTIAAVTNTKTYDATTAAAATPAVNGLKGSDTVTGSAETYDNRNAGIGKTLSVSAYTINDGNGGGNYAVTTFNDSTGVINKAPLTIAAVTNVKTYDGTTSAAATPAVNGLKGSDTVTGLVETYDNKNAGTGKTLTVSTYTVNDGNGGGNYAVTALSNATGVIAPPGGVTLLVTNYQLVGTQAGSGGWVYTTYQADVLNFGNPLGAVTATVASSNPYSVRTLTGQNILNFGTVPANGQVTSVNTFTVLINSAATQPFDFSMLLWTFQTTPAPPVANAGPPQTVPVGSTVTLDGSGSTNPGGVGTLAYSWIFTSRPPGSLARLYYSPATAAATFVADAPGAYVVTLTVSNGVASGSANVTITAGQ